MPIGPPPLGGGGGIWQSSQANALVISFIKSNSLAEFSITKVAMPNAISATARILVTFFMFLCFRGFWFMLKPKYCPFRRRGL